MKHAVLFTAITLSLITFSGCKKTSLDSILPKKIKIGKYEFNMNPPEYIQGACPNEKRVSLNTQYKNDLILDDFNGGDPSSPCYSQEAYCQRRMDWSMYGDCTITTAHLGALNKCLWKTWDGYSFWNKEQLKFDPRAIEIKDGRLILKILPNPDYDPTKGTCGQATGSSNLLDVYNTNCKLLGGAVDTTFQIEKNSPGYLAKFGRIEMKSRYVHTNETGGFPAFWMWAEKDGRGHSFPKQSWVGEIDILEMEPGSPEVKGYALQTYHDWNGGNGSAANSGKVKIDDTADQVYGVEWSPGSIKWYINDCYTHEVKTGDLANFGKQIGTPVRITEAPSFIMLWNGASGWGTNLQNRDRLEVDWVKVYK